VKEKKKSKSKRNLKRKTRQSYNFLLIRKIYKKKSKKDKNGIKTKKLKKHIKNLLIHFNDDIKEFYSIFRNFDEGGNVKSEKLDDYELGWRYVSDKIKVDTNIYYMAYKDQLILTGNLDNVGNPIRSNSEKSFRLGLEVDATIAISKQVFIEKEESI
jgi:hypothetical protein